MQITHTNRLIHATSPYLLQHAHNPVDWYEWGKEALEKAINEDKPLLVSIGYSSCHWCHVMERECFENSDIAAVMNEHFVCIKVDREERPDIDQLYMDAVQALGVNGGWPLNVFLLPDQKPFYGGTYFPPQTWVQLLTNIHKAYGTKRPEIEGSASELSNILLQSDVGRFRRQQEHTTLQNDLAGLYGNLAPQFDLTWGGLHKAPKFVMPATWQLLLRHHYLTGHVSAREHVTLTLKRIAMGGIHDQVGGGFARYSVDGEWFAPHFEKMLYDNAQLMSLYAEAYRLTGDEEFKQVVHDLFDWLQRDMTSDDGGFYSALDADSEGEEGRYYVWKKDELATLLSDEAALVMDYFSVKENGNWEHGNNILCRSRTDAEFIAEKKLSPEQWDRTLRDARQKLLKARSLRTPPGLDDKIITAWNALMVTGLTDAYRATGQERYRQAAEKNIRFIEDRLCENDTLYRSYKNKRSVTTGFLDDYAFVIQAYIHLYQVTFHEAYLMRARALTRFTMDHFFDHQEAFFYYTGNHGETLISRKKELFDNVVPSSNSVMARNLLYLGTMLEDAGWLATAREMTGSLAGLILSEPNYMANWAIALLETKQPMAEVAFAGAEAQSLRAEFHARYFPFSITFGAHKDSVLPLLEGKEAVGGRTTLFVCFNKTCKQPVHTVAEAEKQLGESLKIS